MSTIAYRDASRLLSLIDAFSPHALGTQFRILCARHASRAALARMDERLLADIGVTREQALREAARPFWVE